MPISSNSLKRSFRKISLIVITKENVLLAACIFQSIFVTVVIKVVAKYFFKSSDFEMNF